MLKERVLKESFVALKIGGQSVANISVYLIPGKNAPKLMTRSTKIYISDGLQQGQSVDFEEVESPEDNKG